MTRTEKLALTVCIFIALGLLVGAVSRRIPLQLTEVFAFISGAAGVYLTVKRSLWNFPIGLANNVFFGVLFFQERLLNDFGLQIVYFVLGAWGWTFWARRRNGIEVLPISRASWRDLLGCLVFIALGTPAMMKIAQSLGGAAPFWDALTTALSLSAQYLLGRKFLENWAFWLLADIIYVPLYISRGLHLTGALYFGFGCLCVMGFLAWKEEWTHETMEDGRDHRQISAAASRP